MKNCCEILQREFFSRDLFFNDAQLFIGNDERETCLPIGTGQQRGFFPTKFTGQKYQQLGRDERHVAREKEDGVGAGGFERGENPAEWATTRDEVAGNGSHGKSGGFGCGADVAEHRSIAETQTGFVASHASAQSAGEDADFEDGRDGNLFRHGKTAERTRSHARLVGTVINSVLKICSPERVSRGSNTC